MGSFVVVLIMMVALFRSLLMGVLAMIPLTLTVGLIYGIIGLIGKDYDMPVAILSALSLGLAVDYAIHFLARSKEAVAKMGSWQAAVSQVFGEPARAISRNAIVLSAGFLPLLAAPLVPYQTVGIFIAAIILSAGIATLVILPALATLLQKFLFKKEMAK
jgi:predicted RND superfamily exporter protein